MAPSRLLFPMNVGLQRLPGLRLQANPFLIQRDVFLDQLDWVTGERIGLCQPITPCHLQSEEDCHDEPREAVPAFRFHLPHPVIHPSHRTSLDKMQFHQVGPAWFTDACAREDHNPLPRFHEPLCLQATFRLAHSLIGLSDLLHRMGNHPPIERHLPAYSLKWRESDDGSGWALLR